jgi:oxygen-independent coproporphyrinogen-3 oxidase
VRGKQGNSGIFAVNSTVLLTQAASSKLDPAALPSSPVDGLYVHIPFCFHKCHYCDFYSITRQTPERMDRFVDLILREADGWRKFIDFSPRTVFFGGGTPTLLPLENMRRLIAGLRERFDFSNCDEWTVEANPATVSLEYCRMLKDCGVNRMSFGAQSFNPSDLAILERHHDPDDVPKSLAMARDAGFERLNVDLIYAIPGQSMESWMMSLEKAIALGTEHISCYGLTYEPNTPMAVRRRMGQFVSTEAELEIAMMRATRDRLAGAGLEAYEISNYAIPGQECRHNLIYWRGENYLGLGPSAASHVSGWRWRNAPHLGEWERSVESDISGAVDVENLMPQQRAGELAMLLLRLKTGLEFQMFAARSGYDARVIFSGPIDRFTRQGLLRADESGIRLTDAGLSVADGIAAEFLAAAESFTS